MTENHLELYTFKDIDYIRLPTGENYEDGLYFKVKDISRIETDNEDCKLILAHGGSIKICNMTSDEFIKWLLGHFSKGE